MTGFGGKDSFVFSTALGTSNVDTITDFSHVDDTIQLSRSAFAGLSAGTLGADAFWSGAGVTTAHDAADRVIYNTSTGALFYDRDGDGTQFSAVKFAVLSAHPTDVGSNDFSIV